VKSAGDIYRRIADADNIRVGFLKAARGKQGRRDVVDFKSEFEHNIARLYAQIEERRLDIGHYRYFQVFDPKKRLICAASFPERVLHHAVMNVCEPVLDAYAIDDSYACRKGKGGQRAVLRAKAFSSSMSANISIPSITTFYLPPWRGVSGSMMCRTCLRTFSGHTKQPKVRDCPSATWYLSIWRISICPSSTTGSRKIEGCAATSDIWTIFFSLGMTGNGC
jgi:hypothetical protein